MKYSLIGETFVPVGGVQIHSNMCQMDNPFHNSSNPCLPVTQPQGLKKRELTSPALRSPQGRHNRLHAATAFGENRVENLLNTGGPSPLATTYIVPVKEGAALKPHNKWWPKAMFNACL
jgi:hypothetical protein